VFARRFHCSSPSGFSFATKASQSPPGKELVPPRKRCRCHPRRSRSPGSRPQPDGAHEGVPEELPGAHSASGDEVVSASGMGKDRAAPGRIAPTRQAGRSRLDPRRNPRSRPHPGRSRVGVPPQTDSPRRREGRGRGQGPAIRSPPGRRGRARLLGHGALPSTFRQPGGLGPRRPEPPRRRRGPVASVRSAFWLAYPLSRLQDATPARGDVH
jgi:hypothetical protein